MEIERYRVSPSKAHRADKGSSRLDSFIKTLEKERDYYRDECDILNAMIRKGGRSARSPSPTRMNRRSKSPAARPSRHTPPSVGPQFFS